MGLIDAIYGREQTPVTARGAEVRTTGPLTVDIGAGAVPARSLLPSHVHVVGERVLAILTRDTVYVVGSADQRPQLATMQTSAGSTVTVQTDAGATLSGLPYVGTAPATGARVALAWGSAGCIVIGTVGSAPPPPPPPPVNPTDPDPTPTMPPTGFGSVSATAVEVRTARSGSWRTDGRAPRQAYQGHWTSGSSADNIGMLFFGGALAVSGATAQTGAARITLTRDTSAGMSAAREVRIQMAAPDRGGSTPPALLGTATVIGSLARGATGTFPLPDWSAQGLLDSTYGGIALIHPGTTNYLSILGLSASGGQQPSVTIPYITGG